MKAEKIAVGVLFIGSLLAIIYYAAPSIFNSVKSSERKIETLVTKDPLEKYRIDLSKGKTEIEKTLIIKYNNILEIYYVVNKKYPNGVKGEMTSEDFLQTTELREDFQEFAVSNQKNVRLSLMREVVDNLQAFFDDFPMAMAF